MDAYSCCEGACEPPQLLFCIQVAHCGLHVIGIPQIFPEDCDVADGVLRADGVAVEEHRRAAAACQRAGVCLQGREMDLPASSVRRASTEEGVRQRSHAQPGAVRCLQDRDAVLLAACWHGQKSKTMQLPSGHRPQGGGGFAGCLQSTTVRLRLPGAWRMPAEEGCWEEAPPQKECLLAGGTSYLQKRATIDETIPCFPDHQLVQTATWPAWRFGQLCIC